MRGDKLDANQNDVVKALRKIPGVSVLMLNKVKNGCPDLLIGFKGKNFLIELKDPAKPPSAQKLTPYEVNFHARWTGHVAVARHSHEIFDAIQRLTKY